MTADTVALHDLIRDVVAKREAEKEARAAYAAALAEFQVAHGALLDRQAEAGHDLKAAEETLRCAAVTHWLASDRTSKTVAPGVGIQERTVVEYDAERALQWSLDHGFTNFAKLDAKAFETFAGTSAGLPGLPAEVKKVPVATLASDLGRFV